MEAEIKQLLDSPLGPTTLRRILLLMTRLHFSDPKHFGLLEKLLGNLRYSDPSEESALTVELMAVFDPEKMGAKPAVYVGLQPFTFGKKVVDNFAGYNGDNSSIYSVLSTDVTAVIRHCAQKGDMASLMGESSAAFFYGLRNLLMTRLPLRAFDIVTLSDPKLIEKAPERSFQVDLVCRINFCYSMTTNLESHRIKKIDVTFNPEAT